MPVHLCVTPLKWDRMISNVPAGIGITSFTPFPEKGINLMIQELSNLCLAGEIDNTTNNRIDGWLRLRGMASPVILEITGNCAEGLQGKRVLFQRSVSADCLVDKEELVGLAFHQVGAAGNIDWSADDGDRGRLVVQWYGQDGQMKIEWPRAVVEFRDSHVPSMSATTAAPLDFSSIPPARWAWSPSLTTGAEETSSGREFPTIQAGDPWTTDIDHLYQFLDELGDGSHDVPIVSLLESPPSHELPAGMRPAQVQEALRDQIAQLARLGVSVNICPHFSAERALRWLLEEVIFEEQIHPRMVCHGYVSFYMTSDRCAECNLEFDRGEELLDDE